MRTVHESAPLAPNPKLGDLYVEGYPVVDQDGVVLGDKIDTYRLDPFPASHFNLQQRVVALSNAKGLKKGCIYFATAVGSAGQVLLHGRTGLYKMDQFAKLTLLVSNESANDN